jgi:hypothetical protein
MQDIVSNINLYLPFVLDNLPYVILLIQIIALIILYVNTDKIRKDKNAREYYESNLAASILFSLPLLFIGLIHLYVHVSLRINPGNTLATAATVGLKEYFCGTNQMKQILRL